MTQVGSAIVAIEFLDSAFFLIMFYLYSEVEKEDQVKIQTYVRRPLLLLSLSLSWCSHSGVEAEASRELRSNLCYQDLLHHNHHHQHQTPCRHGFIQCIN